MKRLPKPNPQNRRGVTAVEFAMTLPVLFLFLFATYELGRANMMVHTAEAAAYEGARLGIIPGAQVAESVAATEAVLATAGIRNANVAVQIDSLDLVNPVVSVDVSFKYSDNSFIPPALMGNGTLTKTCVLSREDSN